MSYASGLALKNLTATLGLLPSFQMATVSAVASPAESSAKVTCTAPSVACDGD